MRVSVLESITEVEIPALEAILNQDLLDNNILIKGGVKVDIYEDEIIEMLQTAIDKFQAE